MHSRFIVLWGTNTIVTNLHYWPLVREAQRRGARVVVIDPVRTRTAEAADWHLQIRPASDAVLALAVMHVMIRDGLVDHDYVAKHAVGYDALAERVRQYAPRDKMQPLLARMWLAWLGFAALGEALAKRPLGLQELTTLWSEQAPLMHVIARWDAVPVFKPGPVELPNVDPGNFVRTLGQRCVDNKKDKRTLGALVGSVMGATDAATRIAALRMAEPILRVAF